MREKPESRRLGCQRVLVHVVGRTYFRFILKATFRMAISPVIKAAWSTRCAGFRSMCAFSRAWYFLMLLGAAHSH
jgi:hypothetical protein